VIVTVMATTLGDTAAAVPDQLWGRGVGLRDGRRGGGGAGGCLRLGDRVVETRVVETRVTAYVPVLARTAARAAMTPSSASLRSSAG